jgi:hypothetical protein
VGGRHPGGKEGQFGGGTKRLVIRLPLLRSLRFLSCAREEQRPEVTWLPRVSLLPGVTVTRPTPILRPRRSIGIFLTRITSGIHKRSGQ